MPFLGWAQHSTVPRVHDTLITWAICALATAGVILRPFKLPEAIWAATGAALLVVGGLLPAAAALRAVGRGTEVYLFLTGMMLLSESARLAGVFDWLAAHAARIAHGSAARLFTLVFGIGTVVTIFMSNDATAVVLTPAVYAVARAAHARPRPLLFACALIANAASFVLPISNPANLVLFAGQPPSLLAWLAAFALPSALAIGATYAVLRLRFRHDLALACSTAIAPHRLRPAGRLALAGIGATSLILLATSALDARLGAPTALAGLLTAAAVLLRDRKSPWAPLRAISWSVLPLVAGLFVLVEALSRTGVVQMLSAILAAGANHAQPATAAIAGATVGVASNLMNNLPAGLIASTAIAESHPSRMITDAMLIGVDLSPNLSITGSLATILWLSAIRREGEDIGFWDFLAVGALAMPPALVLAIMARIMAE